MRRLPPARPERPPPLYVSAFHPDFHAVRLEGEALTAVLNGYGAIARRREPSGLPSVQRLPRAEQPYTVDHTAGIFVIGRDGQLRLRFPLAAPLEQVVSGTSRLLEASP